MRQHDPLRPAGAAAGEEDDVRVALLERRVDHIARLESGRLREQLRLSNRVERRALVGLVDDGEPGLGVPDHGLGLVDEIIEGEPLQQAWE